MKTFGKSTMMALCIGFLFSATSCTVVFFKKDNGKHNGWHKNPNNPHNPNNPQQEKQKGKSKQH